MIQACIFDLDGVIVDTAHYHYLAWKRLAHELGFELTPLQNEKLKGVSRIESLEIVLKLGNVTATPEEKKQLADKKNQWFVDYVNQMKPDEIFPGVKSLLSTLRSEGLRVALASSSKNALTVISQLQIEEEFEVKVDGSMITHTKPHPEIFLLAAKLLNLEPSACLVFEDAEAGVDAAHAAGMACVGVGSSQMLSKADWIVNNTADFDLSMLEELHVKNQRKRS